MTSTAQLLAFGGVVALGAMSPGPDFAVVVRQAALSGRGQGMAATLGIAVGVFGWATAAVTGMAALVAASVVAFTVIKVLGAVYLLYLGVRALRSAMHRDGGAVAAAGPATQRQSWWAAFREGLLCNALNPKAAMFYIALVPQFVTPAATPVDIGLLAAVALVVTGAWFLVVANLVGTLRLVFTRAPVRRALDALSGVVLIALGIRLASSTQAT